MTGRAWQSSVCSLRVWAIAAAFMWDLLTTQWHSTMKVGLSRGSMQWPFLHSKPVAPLLLALLLTKCSGETAGVAESQLMSKWKLRNLKGKMTELKDIEAKGQIQKATVRLLHQEISANSGRNSASFPQRGCKGVRTMRWGTGSGRAATSSFECI